MWVTQENTFRSWWNTVKLKWHLRSLPEMFDMVRTEISVQFPGSFNMNICLSLSDNVSVCSTKSCTVFWLDSQITTTYLISYSRTGYLWYFCFFCSHKESDMTGFQVVTPAGQLLHIALLAPFESLSSGGKLCHVFQGTNHKINGILLPLQRVFIILLQRCMLKKIRNQSELFMDQFA